MITENDILKEEVRIVVKEIFFNTIKKTLVVMLMAFIGFSIYEMNVNVFEWSIKPVITMFLLLFFSSWFFFLGESYTVNENEDVDENLNFNNEE